MIMAGLYFMKEVPFENVYLHGLIRDEFGKKMSKSLGNSPDPSELIDKYGCDALRFTMVSLTPRGSDVLFAERNLETGRNFANKVWNAARLVKTVGEGAEAAGGDPAEMGLEWSRLELCDRWIASRAAAATVKVRDRIDDFGLNEAAKSVYDFVWHEFCDWYLELAKERFYSEDPAVKAGVVATARRILGRSLVLLHPVMPFLSEEVWHELGLGQGSLLEQKLPLEEEFPTDLEAEKTVATVISIVEAVRNIRGEMGIHPSANVALHLVLPGGQSGDGILGAAPYIKKMGKVSTIEMGKPRDGGPVATSIVGGIELVVPLAGVIDVDVEKARLTKEIERITGLLARAEAKAANPEFAERAPAEIVAKERDKIAILTQTKAKLEKTFSTLLGK
jgi:valyl-tRNA synthetase